MFDRSVVTGLISTSAGYIFFFLSDPPPPEISPLPLPAALPIGRAAQGLLGGQHRHQRQTRRHRRRRGLARPAGTTAEGGREGDDRRVGRTAEQARPRAAGGRDRKSTRLNSSPSQNSYAGFCLKK